MEALFWDILKAVITIRLWERALYGDPKRQSAPPLGSFEREEPTNENVDRLKLKAKEIKLNQVLHVMEQMVADRQMFEVPLSVTVLLKSCVLALSVDFYSSLDYLEHEAEWERAYSQFMNHLHSLETLWRAVSLLFTEAIIREAIVKVLESKRSSSGLRSLLELMEPLNFSPILSRLSAYIRHRMAGL